MDNRYTEAFIERMERYESGMLSPEERSAFEAQLANDPAFRQLFEQHRLLVEGIEWASYREEREKLREIHAAIAGESGEGQGLAEPASVRRMSIRRLSAVAAIFLVGVLTGLGPTILKLARPDKGYGEVYGGTSDEIPVLEKTIPLIILSNRGGLARQEKTTVRIALFQGGGKNVTGDWDGRGLRIYLGASLPQVRDWDRAALTLVLQTMDDPEFKAAMLKINESVLYIPLTDEDFSKLALLQAAG